MPAVVALTGVYDADGGLRGEAAYLWGKLAGRHCALCDITHSPVRRRREWDAYVAGLPVPFDVVHRNERTPQVDRASAGHEPCVVAHLDSGEVVLLLDAAALGRAHDVRGLGREIPAACARAHLIWPERPTDSHEKP